MILLIISTLPVRSLIDQTITNTFVCNHMEEMATRKRLEATSDGLNAWQLREYSLNLNS